MPKNWLEVQQKLICIHILTMGRQTMSVDGSFNDILDHVENSSFFPYAGPQCNGGDCTEKMSTVGATTHTLLMGATVWGGDTAQY